MQVKSASLMPQRVKSLPAIQEIQVLSLGWEKGMATHSSILAWRTPRTEEAWLATIHGVANTPLGAIRV